MIVCLVIVGLLFVSRHTHQLRQCVSDFVLDRVRDAIVTIGCTVLLTEPWQNPFTLSRTFCAFEVYVTVDAQVAFEAVTPSEELATMLADMRSASDLNEKRRSYVRQRSRFEGCLESVRVHLEHAQARHQKDKDLIDDFIVQGPGFEYTNSIVTHAVRGALLIQAHKADAAGD